MPLTAGAQLGPYEILAAIGAGGMGEVYSAKDTRLNRTVAIKVLSPELAGDLQFRDRFHREARAISQLDHPNVCTLYDVGEDAGRSFLVMQYLEGETLEARLRSGALPLDHALQVAIQMAEALDAAHRHGVVHRDLKPANVMLTKAGPGSASPPQAKLLDFGLAKTGAPVMTTSGLSMLPTTSPTLTAQGTILGTFHYMAPEQLHGQEADARADIFAFGAVIHEAVTGRRAFDGVSPASIIAAILERQPPALSTLQPLTPPALDHVVQRCLAKEADSRWQSARDLIHELTWIQRALERSPADLTGQPSVTQPFVSRLRRWSLHAAAVLAAAVALAAAAIWLFDLAPRSVASPVRRVTIKLPPGERLALGSTTPIGLGRVALALSPDGSTLVYAGRRLYARQLDSFESRALSKTDGAYAPAFSPDAQWIAFVSGETLQKVSVSGGDPVILCDARNVLALHWTDRGIVLLDQFGSRMSLVGPAGGSPQVVGSGGTAVDSLPGTDSVLVSGNLGLNNPDRATTQVVSLTNDRRTILPVRGVQPHYMSAGVLTFGRGGTLFAVPFDVGTLRVSGQEAPVETGVRMEVPGIAHYAISSDGTLAYVPGGTGWNAEPVWVTPGGDVIPTGLPVQPYGTFRISPDGRRLAFVQGGVTDQIWVFDFQRRTLQRVTHEADNSYPLWTPDGRRLIFRRVSGERESIWWAAVGEDGASERLITDSSDNLRPYSVSPDGSRLAYVAQNDLMLLELTGTSATRPVVTTPYTEGMPMFSPDGDLLAYTSDESGRTEVYVRPLSNSHRIQVSFEGGEEPVWAKDGRRLFYRNGDRWMVTDVGRGGDFSPARAVLQGPYLNVAGFSYDVARDGRLLLLRGVETAVDVSIIHVVFNWVQELKSRMPTK